MPGIPTVGVSRSTLNSLFHKFDIWHKIKKGQITSKIIDSTPSYHWPDATSEIIKHFTLEGNHIATTHRVRDAAGKILHWDAKDFLLKDIRYRRT